MRYAFVEFRRRMICLSLGIFLAVALAFRPALAQDHEVTGVVRDAATEVAIPGVNILVRGTQTGAATNAEGRYEIAAASPQDTLVFSFIGYEAQEVPIDGRSAIDVQLQEQIAELGEVVVTGYMQEEKADLTGSVSVVDSSVMETNQYTNVAKSLQGKVAGVNITTDGDPTGNADIQIRGITSVNANPPLIVVDGMPTQLNLSDIDSGNIASMQVLKDAASASIYGSRAASGVILIETKKGNRGRTTVNYRGSIGGASIVRRPDMLNTEQYGRALWRASINDGLDPNEQTQLYTYDWHMQDGEAVLNDVTPREWLNEEETMPAGNTNWLDEVLRTGLRQKHQITVSTGTEKARALFSGSFFQNQGVIRNSGLNDYTIRLNSDYDISDVLRIGENISLSNKTFRSGVNGAIRNALIMPSIVPVRTNTGEWGGSAYAYGMDDYNNPVRQLEINENDRNSQSKIVGSVFAELTPLEGLTFKVQGGMDYTQSYFRNIDRTWREGGGKQDVQSGVGSDYWNERNMTLTNTVTYNRVADRSDLKVLGGVELFEHRYEGFNAYRQDIELEDRDYAYLGTATGNTTVGGSGNEYTMLSFFSRANYQWNSRYLLSGTVRYDGSSVFGSNNRYAFFPAVSAGWRLTEESFFPDEDFISQLKLRASWGINGNSNIPSTARFNFYDADYYSTAYAISGQQTGQLASGYRQIQTGNPNLQWEETTQYTVGLDYGFLNARLSGTLDLYYKNTTDMLFNPPSLGAIGEGGSQWVNAADMVNRGIEFAINYQGNPASNFTYNIGLNLSSNQNEITSLPNAVRFAYGGNGIDDDIQGKPLNSFYGFVADGLFRSEEEVESSPEQPGKSVGRIRYKDLNGDGKITWAQDRKWLGSSDPDFTFGFNFDAEYRNWDFSMFWQGVAGNFVYNSWKTYSDFWNVWTQSGFNHTTRILNAWSPQNPDSDIPALSLSNANDERRLSTYLLESGSYLKLRNLQLGYTLPSSLHGRIGARKLRLFVNANNIVTIKKWWGDDQFTGNYPETSTKSGEYTNPYMRPAIFSAGVDVTF